MNKKLIKEYLPKFSICQKEKDNSQLIYNSFDLCLFDKEEGRRNVKGQA